MSRNPAYFHVGMALAALAGLAAIAIAGGSSMSTTAHPIPAGQPGRYFTWAEFKRSGTASRLGIDNTPTPEAAARIRLLCKHVLDPLRAHLGRAVRITSGYRHPNVNARIKGSASRSQHMLGEAADIKVEGISAVQLATIIVRLGLPVDQVIWYDPERGGHVHLSYTQRRQNRGEKRHAPADGGYPFWSPPAISGDACA